MKERKSKQTESDITSMNMKHELFKDIKKSSNSDYLKCFPHA